MQRSGTQTIITQSQLSNPKWEITNITNSKNTKRTHDNFLPGDDNGNGCDKALEIT